MGYPTQSDVRLGVIYGAANELTGTYVTASAQAVADAVLATQIETPSEVSGTVAQSIAHGGAALSVLNLLAGMSNSDGERLLDYIRALARSDVTLPLNFNFGGGSYDAAEQSLEAQGDAGDLILANTSRLSTGNNTFRTPFQNGVLIIPQNMTWGTVDPITVPQDGGNWPDLSGYTITLHLALTPKYSAYSTVNNAALSFVGAYSGSGTDQVLAFSPGTASANLQPTLAGAGLNAYPYRAQAWAVSGTNRVLLFSGFADVTDDIRS